MTNLLKKGQKTNRVSITVYTAVIFAFILFFMINFII